MDPFAAALRAQFRAPGSVAAIYTPADAPALPEIRVIRSQRTDEAAFGQGSILVDSNVVQIQRADVAEPQHGDELAIGDELLIIQGGARLDVEGLTWTCMFEPAP